MIKRGVGSGVLVQQQRGANVTLLCSGQVLCIALTTLIPRLLAELQCICVCVGGGRTLSSPGKIVDFIESFTFFHMTCSAYILYISSFNVYARFLRIKKPPKNVIQL